MFIKFKLLYLYGNQVTIKIMYLSQTKLELDLSVVYDLDGQEVYLTIPVKNCCTQLMTKRAWEVQGLNGTIYSLSYDRKKKLKIK